MKPRTALLLTASAVIAAATLRAVRRADPPAPGSLLSAKDTRHLYDRLAPFYDLVAGTYGLLGAGRFHRRAVEALRLTPGDTAIDLGCGTGANLPLLAHAVGPAGRVVGVDLSPGMLTRARRRVRRWPNVMLVESDVRTFAFPERVDGIVSTYALEMVPGYEGVVERAAAALRPGGRMAIGGLRSPEGWPDWLLRLGEAVNRPFGVSRAYEAFAPWQSVQEHLREVDYEERLFGGLYLATGTRLPGA